jgi:hypothetical protein
MASSVQISDLVRWPKQIVQRYQTGIVQQIRISVRMHAPVLFQTAIAGVKPYQPVNTGDYKRSGKVKDITDGALFYNPTIQASIIDRGRRAGVGVSRAGQEALARWVHLHGMDRAPMSKHERRARRKMRADGTEKSAFRFRSRWQQDNRARAIAFLIARAIKRRGLPAKNVIGGMKAELTRRVIDDVEGLLVRGVAL